jgi:SAM-dependent methyltransferase
VTAPDPAGDAQRRMWTVGDYPVIARKLLPISVETVAALNLRPGMRVLDVGVGDGNAAIQAALRGAVVTGIDLTPAQIERATARCASEGVTVDLRVGDAQDLDVADGEYDVVVSVMGMIFAPRAADAIAEMARACRVGGTVAITSWATGGWAVHWRERMAELFPPPPAGGPLPEQWGDPAEAIRRFASAGLDATVERCEFNWEFDSCEEALAVFIGSAGPYIQLMETAASLGNRDVALTVLLETIAAANTSTTGACRLPAPYLRVTAQR